MTESPDNGEREEVLTLQGLIAARRSERGWSYGDLARRGDFVIQRNRWQQLGSGKGMTEFPEKATIEAMARALEVDVTTILVAIAQDLGMEARRAGPVLGHLLPAGTDLLSTGMRDAILTLVRAAVTEAVQRKEGEGEAGREQVGELPQLTNLLSQPERGTAERRNAAR